MSLNFWIHVSTRLPAGIDTDTKRAREILLSALRDEGIDDMLQRPPSRGISMHTGVDGAPRLVCGSTHPVVLRGDEEAFARRLAADIESCFSAAGIEAKTAVVLREDETGDDARRFRTALHHYIDSDLGDELEGARDRMSPDLFPSLVARHAALETWDQRAELIFLCGQRPSPILAPLWRDLLLSSIDTPSYVCGLHLAFQTAINGLAALAGGKKAHDFGTDDEAAKRIIDRVRQHLRLGGEFPLPHRLFWDDENEADEDLDVYAQFARDAAPAKSQADIDELLLTVNDAPGDDKPRRALADAVRARNPKRARLIDLGLEIAEHRRHGRLPPDALAHEHGALVAAHGHAWAGPLAALARAFVFRRGFIEDLTLPAEAVDAFTKRGAGPFSKDPGQPRFGHHECCALLDLQIDGAKGRIAELLNRQPFAGLRSLRLPAQGLTNEDALALASCPQLAKLRGLDLHGNQIGWQGLRAIAAAFRDLRWFDVSANAVEDPAAVDEAPEAGLSETGRSLVRELGPLPWLESQIRNAQGLTPFPEQL